MNAAAPEALGGSGTVSGRASVVAGTTVGDSERDARLATQMVATTAAASSRMVHSTRPAESGQYDWPQ